MMLVKSILAGYLKTITALRENITESSQEKDDGIVSCKRFRDGLSIFRKILENGIMKCTPCEAQGNGTPYGKD